MSTSKKVQSRRFALQELLKQFLLVYRYYTSNFLFHKKEHRNNLQCPFLKIILLLGNNPIILL